jgi:hypothetical protein
MQQTSRNYSQSGMINMVFDVYYANHNGKIFKRVCRQLTKEFPQCSLEKNKDGTLRFRIDDLIIRQPAEVRAFLASIPGVVRVDWLEGYFLEPEEI